MNESDEMLDLVDGNDAVIGAITRGEVKGLFNTSGKYVRYANCFVRNTEGKLWIPRRVATKTIAPSGLDFSASEHVQSGEQYLEAIVRGLEEELNIQAEATSLEFIGKLTPDASRPYFSSIYSIRRDDVPSFNKDDFIDYSWLTIAELITQLENGEIAKADLMPAAMLLTNE